MAKTRFKARLTSGRGGGHFVAVPEDVIEALGGGGRIPIKALINGVPYSGSIMRMGGPPCIGVLKAIIEQTGLAVGRMVTVDVERDTSTRTIEPTADLKAALAKNAAARKAWESLSFTRKREHVQAIEGAKKPETRERRLAAVMAALTGE